MTDSYRTVTDRGLLRPILWVVLVLSTAANAAASSIGVHPLIGAGFGAVTLACIAVLITHHYRHRRSH
ncbi:MAG: hypothetical protein ABW022_19185 [Actinoplanes sp.]